ncbi:glycoside hydrolase family 13 protein [Ligilactobacillus ceti]|uniref:Neopullulanase cyclomaltodextrinase maltogenic alpha-amylase n=1 Tax=Ligilactobacillus ceti DSM 22408 TaxID=1122146 RepID=A0A0R2KSG4_9LACO|nr:glycoside hydrolase family 13 protein [Ligilactobacillus ceti]KRN89133.1 Neopullulanase cyclomaltodextrinase maltogenic alpha-amylase [Ligilactobacillus ceti DSM 22408]
MDKAALYHRIDSEMAFLNPLGQFQIRLRTKHNDVKEVKLLFGDPYAVTYNELDERLWEYTEAKMQKVTQTLEHDFWELALDLPLGRLQYAFLINGHDDERVLYDDRKIVSYNEHHLAQLDCFTLPFNYESALVKPPKWAQKQVWYQIMIDSFANGNVNNNPEGTVVWNSKKPKAGRFFGGDLAGIIGHLDYLKTLGINGLYLSPLFTAFMPEKFDTLDYFEIDPSFGTKQEFKYLVDEAHKRGMKIMLDVDFSYLSDNSLQWQDVQENGERSRFADWFQIKEFPVTYQSTQDPTVAKSLTYNVHGFNPHMPKLNTANEQVRKYLLDVATYWIEQFDIDAWHLEYAAELDKRFLMDLQQAVKGVKADFYLVGEVKHYDQNLVAPLACDSVVNYPLTETILDYCLERNITLEEMVSQLNEQDMRYRSQTASVLINAVESHVTSRLAELCHGDQQLVRAILAFVFLQKGVPSLFYGTEIGLTGGKPPLNRSCMIWEEEQQDQTMLRFMKVLIHLRTNYADLLSEGEFHWGQRSNKFNYLSFSRKKGNRKIFALFNFGYTGIKFVQPKHAKLLLSQNVIAETNVIAENGFVILEA